MIGCLYHWPNGYTANLPQFSNLREAEGQADCQLKVAGAETVTVPAGKFRDF